MSSNKNKRPQLVIGFSIETNNEIKNSLKKMKSKRCNWIIVNKLNKKNMIFGSDFNKITLVKKDKIIWWKKMSKINVSKKIVEEIIKDIE